MPNEKSTEETCVQPNFEDSLCALEEIVQALEEGQIGLAESLSRYEAGVKLLKQCYQMLERAERRIELVSGIGPEGDAISGPFDDAALSLEEKAQARSQRRSRKVKSDNNDGFSDHTDQTDVDGPRTLF